MINKNSNYEILIVCFFKKSEWLIVNRCYYAGDMRESKRKLKYVVWLAQYFIKLINILIISKNINNIVVHIDRIRQA